MRSSSRKLWTKLEDEILEEQANLQLARGQLKDWNAISTALPDRSNKDCRKRWIKICNAVNKGPWSKSEDEVLAATVAQIGQRWTSVARIVGTRHADQCAKRWCHFLDPSLNLGEWSRSDELRLLDAVQRNGKNWRQIIDEEFPGRSPTNVKNRYYTTLNSKYRKGNNTSTSERESPQLLLNDISVLPSRTGTPHTSLTHSSENEMVSSAASPWISSPVTPCDDAQMSNYFSWCDSLVASQLPLQPFPGMESPNSSVLNKDTTPPFDFNFDMGILYHEDTIDFSSFPLLTDFDFVTKNNESNALNCSQNHAALDYDTRRLSCDQRSIASGNETCTSTELRQPIEAPPSLAKEMSMTAGPATTSLNHTKVNGENTHKNVTILLEHLHPEQASVVTKLLLESKIDVNMRMIARGQF